METRTNSESAHDLDFPDAAVDDLGKRHYAALLSSRPTGSFRATPPPRLLHHIQGRAHSADIAIEDDELLNAIEHELSGRGDLVAEIEWVLPMDNPKDIKSKDMRHSDSLEL